MVLEKKKLRMCKERTDGRSVGQADGGFNNITIAFLYKSMGIIKYHLHVYNILRIKST